MTGYQLAQQCFDQAGLAFPEIPDSLATRLQPLDKWQFASRGLDTTPYDLKFYRHETYADNYVILAHTGHGSNSYAIQYYLVVANFKLFLHLAWGGVYMDEVATTAAINKAFELADQITHLAVKPGLLDKDQSLHIVGSDFYGSSCSDKPLNEEVTPVQILAQALSWLQDLNTNHKAKANNTSLLLRLKRFVKKITS